MGGGGGGRASSPLPGRKGKPTTSYSCKFLPKQFFSMNLQSILNIVWRETVKMPAALVVALSIKQRVMLRILNLKTFRLNF